MSLKNLKLRTEVIEVLDGESFTVRGLSFTDMSSLYVKYATEMSAVFGLLAKGQGETIDVEQAAGVAAAFIHSAPSMAAEVIALACGEPESFEVALTLPFPVQVEAIKKIGLCTFGTEGAGKKFMTTLGQLVLTKTQAAANQKS